MFSTDEQVFDEGSEVRRRMIALSRVLGSLHIIVFARKAHAPETRLGELYLYAVGGRSPLAIIRAWRLGQALTGKIAKPAVITSQEAFTSPVAFLLRWKSGIPVQVQVHTDFLTLSFRRESVKNFFRYLMYRWSVRHADSVRVVSERIKRELVSLLRIPQEKIVVLPIAVDVRNFGATRSGGPNLRLLYPGKHPVVLVVARLTPEKDVLSAIEIFHDFLRRVPTALLVIVGDGPLRTDLERHVRQLAIAQSVHFAGWQADPAPYFQNADILLVTSRYEGYGRMFVEAAAAGLPIVSTDVGAIGELFHLEESALVFRSASEATGALARIAGDPELGRRLSAKARAVAESLSNPENYPEQYRQTLLRTLSPRDDDKAKPEV